MRLALHYAKIALEVWLALNGVFLLWFVLGLFWDDICSFFRDNWDLILNCFLMLAKATSAFIFAYLLVAGVCLL